MANVQPSLKAEPLPVACFAPPLSDELLAEYRATIAAVPAGTELRDALDTLLKCVEAWWALPESKADPDARRLAIRHRGKDVRVPLTPLEDQYVQKLWDVTPWFRELKAMTPLFHALDPKDPLRTCAIHLRWHCKELTLDREPLTQDKLPA